VPRDRAGFHGQGRAFTNVRNRRCCPLWEFTSPITPPAGPRGVDPDRPTSVPERLHFDALGASNDVVLRLAAQGAAEHTTVTADTLTDARCGTQQWHAPRGGLWMSALWTPDLPVEAAPRLTVAATWGVREGLRRATRVEAGYKWPNDLLVDDAKIGAVRLEGRVEDGRVRRVAVGVGVNANNPTSELPGDLPATATSVLETTGREVDLDALQEAVTGGLRETRGLLDEPRALNRSVAGAWTQKGAGVEVDLGHAMASGRAVGLTDDGGLELDDDGTRRRVEQARVAKFTRVVGPVDAEPS